MTQGRVVFQVRCHDDELAAWKAAGGSRWVRETLNAALEGGTVDRAGGDVSARSKAAPVEALIAASRVTQGLVADPAPFSPSSVVASTPQVGKCERSGLDFQACPCPRCKDRRLEARGG